MILAVATEENSSNVVFESQKTDKDNVVYQSQKTYKFVFVSYWAFYKTFCKQLKMLLTSLIIALSVSPWGTWRVKDFLISQQQSTYAWIKNSFWETGLGMTVTQEHPNRSILSLTCRLEKNYLRKIKINLKQNNEKINRDGYCSCSICD